MKSSLLTEISDSDLPYKVDLVDWRNVNDLWRETTGAELVALLEGPAP